MLKYILKQLFKPFQEDIHVYTNPIRRLFGTLPVPYIHFGRIGKWWRPYPFILQGRYLNNHKWIIGLTGKGKSKLMADMARQYALQGVGIAFIDPHSDSAKDLFIAFAQDGLFDDPELQQKFLYIDFGAQDARRSPTHFVPFNILKQPYDKYIVARGVVEAMKRVWPYLRDNAPVFENVLLYALLTLIDNNLPLTKMHRLLTDKDYRDNLLENVTDREAVYFFKYRYDKWKDQNHRRESTLNKVTLFTFTPLLKYSLGAEENMIDFRKIIDEGFVVIFDLGGLDEESQRLIGALLMVGFEEAALSRDNILERKKRREFHLFVDEFDKFSAQSATSFTNILTQTRKFNVFLTLANQTVSQTTERLMGALQYTAIFVFRLGADDSSKLAGWLRKYDPLEVKHEVSDPAARASKHPIFYAPQEILEKMAGDLSSQYNQDLYIKIDNKVWEVKSRTFPPLTVGWDTIDNLMQSYRDRWLIKREAASALTPPAERIQLTSGREKPQVLA